MNRSGRHAWRLAVLALAVQPLLPALTRASTAPPASQPRAGVQASPGNTPSSGRAEIVSSVSFAGAEYFRDETLGKMIKQRKGTALDLRQVEDDARTIAHNYRARGFLHAEIRPVLHRAAGQTAVVFEIQAGPRAKVRRVLVQGNKALTDAEATAGLFTKPDELFGAFKQAGIFHAKRLDNDMQVVARNYYRRGYLEARVQRWRARAAPASDAIDVSLDVDEGPLYRIGTISFSGDLPSAVAELHQALGVGEGDVADLVGLGEQVDKLLDLWRERGYPFPRAVQSPQLDAEAHLLLTNIHIDKGERSRIGEIRLRGEPWTSRRVILRDLDFAPGDLYDIRTLRTSRSRMLESGLFVDAKLTPVSTPDSALVDVEVEVTERPGIIKDCIFNIAPAYFQSEGLIGVGILICPNFLGQGQRVSAIGQLSSLRQLFDLSWSEPRFMDTRLGLTLGAHRRRLIYPLFSANTLGADVGLSRELIADARASISYTLESVDIEPIAALAPFTDTLRFPQGVARSALTARLSHDTRKGGLQPGPGMYHALSVSTGGFWTLGDISFVEARGTARYFVPLVLKALLKLNFQAATIFDPTGKPVVVSERFFLGGYGSVRGYLPRSLGPTQRFGDPSDPSAEPLELYLGGVHEVLANIEVEVPIIREWDLRGFAFLDAGNAFDETENFLLWGDWDQAREVPLPLGLYSSIGAGLLLPTGTLPIRLEWSVPLTRRLGDRNLDFFFGVGGMF